MSQETRRSYPPDSALAMMAAADGWPLRVFNWPVANGQARGSILFQAGRGDMFEKYLETLAHWHEAGWDVTSFDWRGQGGSGRLAQNPNVGHNDDFQNWIDDLADFYARWAEASPGPHVVMGHSMGGHLVLRALVEQRIKPDGAVLSAPMLGFDTPAFMRRIGEFLASKVSSETPAWPSNEKPSLPGASRQKMLTHDDGRYADELWWHEQHPELKLGPPSWQWLRAAYRSFEIVEAPGGLESIGCPVTVIATSGDKLVSPAAARSCAARIPNCDLTMFNKSVAHEILREKDAPRDHAIARIDALLSRLSPE